MGPICILYILILCRFFATGIFAICSPAFTRGRHLFGRAAITGNFRATSIVANSQLEKHRVESRSASDKAVRNSKMTFYSVAVDQVRFCAVA